MIAVLSATEHDYYAMPLPFAVYSWAKIGVRCVVFVPEGDNPKLNLAKKYCGLITLFKEFKAEEKRIPTYSQVSRLFGATLSLWGDEELITSDSDICVFGDYLNDVVSPCVVGHDLTPVDQFPMCYIKMKAKDWRKAFNIQKTYQEHISELIDPIEGLNIRGEQWCYDQWYAKKKITESGIPIIYYDRAIPGTQFASKRADRDGWHFDPDSLIDAHLPRPLTDDANFQKVYDLFSVKYPNDDLTWMKEYQQEYKKLL